MIDDVPAPAPGRRSLVARRVAAGLLVIALATGAVIARRSGVDGPMLQRELLALGCLAPPLFLLVFAIGELLHLPGILFVLVARLVFGPSIGFVLGYAGALLAVTVSFTVARQVVAAARATKEPWRPKWRFLRRAFDRLEAHPVQTIALLRLVLWLAPPLSYALASTNIRARDHVVGSAIGLVLPVLAVALLGGYV
ncbi:MAG TPA: VTT domain-containing protein [Labilithrix sp.]|nr:VTT domain-containing protein [Labilithrix sp.]